MKIVYRAENVFDASLVKGLLENDGIMAFVNGAMLQGGVGELPPAGLITVTVADEDQATAEQVIREFQRESGSGAEADEASEDDRYDPSDPLFDAG